MEQRELEELLIRESQDVGLVLEDAAMRMAAQHLGYLWARNEQVNLVSAGSLLELVQRHFLEGALAARLLPEAASLRLMDVGSGAGFPGVPLRVMRADLVLTLLEARGRKAAFLSQVAARIPSPVPRVLTSLLQDIDAEEMFDVISLRGLVLAASHLDAHLAPGGRIITFPPDNDGTDDQSSQLRRLGYRIVDSVLLTPSARTAVAWMRSIESRGIEHA